MSSLLCIFPSGPHTINLCAALYPVLAVERLFPCFRLEKGGSSAKIRERLRGTKEDALYYDYQDGIPKRKDL